MTYSIATLPLSKPMQDLSQRELLSYRDWFLRNIDQRVDELARLVIGTNGYADWTADFTPASLSRLGEWFRGAVVVAPLDERERARIKAKFPFPIEAPTEELSAETLSIAMDVGIYFGEVIRKNVSGTKWDQPTKNKKFADYGHMVLMGFGSVPLNPIRLTITLAFAFAAKEQSGSRLRELFDIWSQMRK